MSEGVFRSDAEVALDDLADALARTTAVHARGADTLGDVPAGRTLRGLADLRGGHTRDLMDAALESDEVPNEPDPDRVTAEGLIQQLRTALAPSQADEVVAESRAAEDRLAKALAAARGESHVGAIERMLARLAEAEPEAQERVETAERQARGES